jgi:hypothetical protein
LGNQGAFWLAKAGGASAQFRSTYPVPAGRDCGELHWSGFVIGLASGWISECRVGLRADRSFLAAQFDLSCGFLFTI